MTWGLMPAPIVKPRHPSQLVAVLSVSVKGGRYPHSCTLTVRPHNLEHQVSGFDWWDHDRRVTLQRGYGDHDGMVRIEPDLNGLWKLTGAQGKGTKPNPPRLVFHPLGMPDKGMAIRGVPIVIKEKWIEITLPPWAKGHR